MVELFGWTLSKKKKGQPEKPQEAPLEHAAPSFAPPVNDDGALMVQATGGSWGTFIDLDGNAKTEAELISRYRNMALHPEVDAAVEEITNEAIVAEEENEIVELALDEVEGLPATVKNALDEEFDDILELLEFKTHAFEVFRRWYVDGRLYYHAIVNPEKLADGIQELRYIDPRKIRKVREIRQTPMTTPGGLNSVNIIQVTKEYYIFNEQGFGEKGAATASLPQGQLTGVQISKDAIVLCTSGQTDPTGKMVVGYLHKAIKPLNMLRAEEDAVVIYRLTRAPERRVFYIDVGNLPKMKAEQYLRDMMTKHKNKLVYDSTTGEIRDDRKYMTTYEDYWLPRREGTQGTQIDTLPGGENLGQMEDVLYFLKKLYRSLNVPVGRLDPEGGIYTGLGPKTTEVTRDEVKFSRFIDRLRIKFSELFLEILGKQLVLRKVMDADEWEQLKPKLKFKWARDNYFAEMKEMQVNENRLATMGLAMPYIGRFFSNDWARKVILKQSDEEIEEQDALIQEEAMDPQFMTVDPETGTLMPSPMAAGPPMLSGPDPGPAAAEKKKSK